MFAQKHLTIKSMKKRFHSVFMKKRKALFVNMLGNFVLIKGQVLMIYDRSNKQRYYLSWLFRTNQVMIDNIHIHLKDKYISRQTSAFKTYMKCQRSDSFWAGCQYKDDKWPYG